MLASKEEQQELQDTWNKISFVAVSMALRYARSLRILAIVTFGFVMLLFMRTAFSDSTTSVLKVPSYHREKHHPMAEALQTIAAPFVHPLTAPYFMAYSGRNFSMKTQNPTFKKPLRKKMCILDIDQRPWSNPNELFDENHPLLWSTLENHSAAFLNHYLYAMIHGYRYTFIRVGQNPGDRGVTWIKVPAMLEHLKTCEYMLFVEADGVFSELTLPLEWQMNYWNFTTETKVAMPIDPQHETNLDWNGKLMVNLGFVLAHNTPRTQEIWTAWANCLDDRKAYPECQKWRNAWPMEQGAYSHIIRYKFNDPDDLMELPCDEANGYPEADWPCYGTLNYQHYWIKKNLVKQKTTPPLLQMMMQSIQLDFLMRKDETVKWRPGYNYGIDSHYELGTGKKCLGGKC